MTEFFKNLEPLVWKLLHKMAKVGAKGLKHDDLFGVLDEARQELMRKEEEEKRTKAIALLETVRQKPVRLRRSGTMR